MLEPPLGVPVVKDEVLLSTELQFLLAEAGCRPVGHGMDSEEALNLPHDLNPDLALVDIHLGDGPTGVEMARRIHADFGTLALFMTANVKRLPDDFADACGVIGKPYSGHGVKAALEYLTVCMCRGQAPGALPVGLTLSAGYARLWGLNDQPGVS